MAPKLIIIGSTGWYGKTLIYEYICKYGHKNAVDNLLLFASRSCMLQIEAPDRDIGNVVTLSVHSLSDACRFSFEPFDGLVWLSFLIKSKLDTLGFDEYCRINQSIASSVFSILSRSDHLRTIFFSSGVALGHDKTPKLTEDPYAHLKIMYHRQLTGLTQLSTFYPYATLGRFVPKASNFAAASFIHQALTTGRIVINSKNQIVRSFGSAHDFSRLILSMYEKTQWTDSDVFTKVIPVTHTLDLVQLAHEISHALNLPLEVVSSFSSNTTPSIYATTDFTFLGQLSLFDLSPTPLASQLQDMAKGDF